MPPFMKAPRVTPRGFSFWRLVQAACVEWEGCYKNNRTGKVAGISEQSDGRRQSGAVSAGARRLEKELA